MHSKGFVEMKTYVVCCSLRTDMHFTIESAFHFVSNKKLPLLKMYLDIQFLKLTNPEKDRNHLPRDLAGIATDCGGQVPGEEGEPADQEGAHHDPQRHEGLVFLPPRGVDSLSLFQGCKAVYNS